MSVIPGTFDPLPGTPEHGFLTLWPTVDPARTTFADLVEYEGAVKARDWPQAIGILERCGATGADQARRFAAILAGRKHNPSDDWREGVRERLRAQRTQESGSPWIQDPATHARMVAAVRASDERGKADRPVYLPVPPGGEQALWDVIPPAHEEARDAWTLGHLAWSDGRPAIQPTVLLTLRQMVVMGKVEEVAGPSGPAFRRTAARLGNPAAAPLSQAQKDRAAGARWVRGLSRSEVFDLGDDLVLGSFDWRAWNLPAKPSPAFLTGADQARMDLE